MSEMVKRVARVIFNGAVGLDHWENLFWRDERDGCFRSARAAIAVEPTEAMICAGDKAIIAALNEHPQDPQMRQGTPAEKCWRAMVGAALGDGISETEDEARIG